MPKLSKRERQLWAFFIDPVSGRRKYCACCMRCRQQCKQSYRAMVLDCSRFVSRRAGKIRKLP